MRPILGIRLARERRLASTGEVIAEPPDVLHARQRLRPFVAMLPAATVNAMRPLQDLRFLSFTVLVAAEAF